MLSEVAKTPKAARRITKSDMPRLGQSIGRAASAAKTMSAIRQSRRREDVRTNSALTPEQAAGFEHQHDGHQQEHQTFGEKREADGAKAAHQSDQQRSDQRAGNRAHAANDGDDEGF